MRWWWCWSVLVTLAVADGWTPAQAQSNLVVNGDAETTMMGVVPGWMVTDVAEIAAYGFDGFPTLTSPGPLSRGANFFAGGQSSSSGLSQTVVFSAPDVTAIAGGNVPFTLCAFLGGFSGQDDNATVTAQFQNGASVPTGPAVTIGPVLAIDRSSVSGMCLRSSSGTVPVGTTKVQISMTFTNLTLGGPYNDGYADNVNFLLAASCPETVGVPCPGETTTTSTTANTTSTTSTTASTSTTMSGSTSSTTTTLGSSSSTTTTGAPTSTSSTSNSSSTTLLPTTTSTTTTSQPSATTTTLPAGDCGVVPVGATFRSIDCRLDALIARIQASTEIQRGQALLIDQLSQAKARKLEALSFCGGSDAKHARKRLKQVVRKLIQFGNRLRSSAGRRSMPVVLRAELVTAGDAVKSDVQTLRGGLSCPDDAPPSG